MSLGDENGAKDEMTIYYQLDVDSLEEAIDYCEGYKKLRPSVVFRGQANAEWPLTSSAFRENAHPLPFGKTDQLINWWSDQIDTPNLNPEQLWQVAQEYAEYGLRTDLIDFSFSIEIATFFALGAPEKVITEVPEHAALFIIDPMDFEKIPSLLDLDQSIPESLSEILIRYTQIWWPNRIRDLHRLEAQKGCFVRDPNGTLEAITDGSMSLLPVIYEEAFGHPPLLKKVTFSPRPENVAKLTQAGVTKASLFPLPNQLEGIIERFVEESKWKVYL